MQHKLRQKYCSKYGASGHVLRAPYLLLYFYVQLPTVCAVGGYRRHARLSWEHELPFPGRILTLHMHSQKVILEAVRLHYFIATMDSFCTGGNRPSIPLELLDAFQ